MLMMSKTSVMMAKGWKQGSGHHDRLLGSFHGHAASATADLSDLVEEDVWSIFDSPNDPQDNTKSVIIERCSSGRGQIGRGSRRWAKREERQVGGLSLTFKDTKKGSTPRIIHQYRPNGSTIAVSAPIDVPDWPKILRVGSVEPLNDEPETVGDEDESDRLPPHEYLARSRIAAASSVFEGVGRTLKGRDMSRVRNAVWRRTGFLG